MGSDEPLDDERRRLYDLLREREAAKAGPPAEAPARPLPPSQRKLPPPPPPQPGTPGMGGFPGMGSFPGMGPPPGTPGWGSTLVEMRPGGSGTPLFIVHALFGSVFPYHKLALHLAPGRPVYGLQARGLDGTESPHTRIRAMAEDYAAEIRAVVPSGPVHLAGYSFGAWVAFETAAALGADHAGMCALLGSGVPLSAYAPEVHKQAESWIQYAEDWLTLIRNAHLAEGGAAGMPSPFAMPWITPMQKVILANNVAAARYRPEVRTGDIELVLSEEQSAQTQFDPTLGWSHVVQGEVHTTLLTGNHLTLFEAPQVIELARTLDAAMARHDG